MTARSGSVVRLPRDCCLLSPGIAVGGHLLIKYEIISAELFFKFASLLDRVDLLNYED